MRLALTRLCLKIDFGSKRRRVLPHMIPKEDFTLQGHRSIVNSVLFHPHQPLIVTAGVEKIVRQFSPFPYSHDPGMYFGYLSANFNDKQLQIQNLLRRKEKGPGHFPCSMPIRFCWEVHARREKRQRKVCPPWSFST
jgi:hypothetical protein